MSASVKSILLGKYRGILVSVALFILLDASVLLLNFFISFQIADDAVGVNLAGRQRMLSQRITKSLYTLELDLVSGNEPKLTVLEELTKGVTLFDSTLNAFMQGGTAMGASGETVNINSVDDPNARAALVEAEALWRPFKKSVDSFVANSSPEERRAALSAALAYAAQHNVTLLGLMNRFTVALEDVATSKANRLRLIQTVGISLAILNFLFILLHFLRQLRESDAVLEEARSETVEILNTVNEGLFLVDSELVIGTQYSKALEQILGQRRIAGQGLMDVLESLVNEKEAKTTADFVGLLFNPKVKEKLIGDLNPLNEIEVNIATADGGMETRYLCFSFSRAMSGKHISHVLVTVVDITERIKLSRELDAVKENTDRQVEMLTGLLHANPALLQEFIGSAYRTYNTINNTLKQPGKAAGQMLAKLNDIFVAVHNFKGEASALKLDNFAERAERFEDQIAQLKNKANLEGNDFLKLAVFLDEIIAYTQQVDALAQRMAAFASPKDAQSSPPTLNPWHSLHTLVTDVAERSGKQAQLVISGLTELNVTHEFRQGLKSTLIQLLRNAVVHGIEPIEERLAAQKPAVGRIDIRAASMAGGMVEIVVQDDGAGFNYDKLRDYALQTGKWSETDIEAWDRKKLVSLIFQPDSSTAAALTQDAGRGIGMAAVLSWVNSHRGKLQVASRPGTYTRFSFVIAVTPVVAEAA